MSSTPLNTDIVEIKELYDHLYKYVQNDWNDIPSGDAWKKMFNSKYSDLLSKFRQTKINNDVTIDHSTETIQEAVKECNELTQECIYGLCTKISRGLEGTWLEMRRRIDAVKNESQSNHLNLDGLMEYATSIGGTCCAPPETNNITDEMLHNQIFPKYHFLGRVGIKDIHSSRFFYLQELSKITFPPIIHFLDGDTKDLKKLKITCSTRGCEIFFRVNNNEKVRTYVGEMPFKNMPFKITAWATAPGLSQSQIVQANYIPNVESKESIHSGLFLGKGKV